MASQGTPAIKQTANTTKGVQAKLPVLLFAFFVPQGIVKLHFYFLVAIGEVFA